MNVAVSILIAVLSNEKLVNLIVGLLGRLVPKEDNAANPEWLEGQAKTMKERIIDSRVPDDGNVFLAQREIERIKQAHRDSMHEPV